MEKQKERVIILDSTVSWLVHVAAKVDAPILIPAAELRKQEGLALTEEVRKQMRHDEALETLRKAADDPNADPRELLALSAKVDPYLVRHELPNRKQRRAALARAARQARQAKIRIPKR